MARIIFDTFFKRNRSGRTGDARENDEEDIPGDPAHLVHE